VIKILETLLVPKERIKVIMDRPTREKIEKEYGVKFSFEDNLVKIDGEGLNLFQAKTVTKAIARGFSPRKAFRLFDEEEFLEIIEFPGKDNKVKLTRSRMIGTKGKTRKMIERFSGCSVSVYGKTVSLIGKYEQLVIAREAVSMIIRGSKHSKVYGFLQQAKK
jgi:ribosomal RNA assembly protein